MLNILIAFVFTNRFCCADFAYLAGLAYRGINVTQRELNGWFGNNTVIDQNDQVVNWRTSVNDSSAVSFKMVTFPNSNNFAFVLIRGTVTNWDMLAGTQSL